MDTNFIPHKDFLDALDEIEIFLEIAKNNKEDSLRGHPAQNLLIVR